MAEETSDGSKAAFAEAEARIREAVKTGAADLYLARYGLAEVPESLGQLSQLHTLVLSGNRLTSVPKWLGKLRQLQTLVLDENQLTSLPESLGQLSPLQKLYLSGNRLALLPEWFGQLRQLQTLDLSRNQLTSLPESLGLLSQLEELYLSGNQLTLVPEWFGRLCRLQTLDLSSNQLISLTESLRNLTELKTLHLHGNDALGLPAEVLGPTSRDVVAYRARATRPAGILDYFFRARVNKCPLNEAKLILVGRGGVGKTSLVKRLLDDTFDPNEKKTEGISISGWMLRIHGTEEVRLNLWDFGGQEIMHATHQFFLTQRTVYLVVLDARRGEDEGNIHYWLKIIRSYGGDSPVLVVINKCESHHLELNNTRLQKDYPSIKGFLTTSCKTGSGIDALKKAIAEQIRTMAHVFVPLPLEYLEIKKELEGLAVRKNYIEISEYYTLCTAHQVETRNEQDCLLRFLHDLGSVLCFNDPDNPYQLREMSVLNPAWVTQGVYKVLNSAQVVQRHGQLLRADLAEILPKRTHPPKCHAFIVEMMKKFELCFAIEEGRKWLVAELLPMDEPNIDWDHENALNFRYDYEFLPPGIICRVIVRRYEDLTEKPIYWRRGAVFGVEGCKVLVRSDTEKGRIYVSVAGPERCRRGALGVIRSEFEGIHASISKLRPEAMVPVPGLPNVAVRYAKLVALEAKGVRTLHEEVEGDVLKLDVQELLNSVDLKGSRRQMTSPKVGATSAEKVQLFYSYCHRDETLRKELEVRLKRLQQDGKIAGWYDRRIEPGDDLGKRIDENLDKANLILLLISDYFLASDACEKEMRRALERRRKGEARVIPVILRPSSWLRTPLQDLLALPQDGKPVTQWRNRDSAWRNVSEGIERVVEQMRGEGRGGRMG